MDLRVKQLQGQVPVTVLETHGDLDASNYQDLIAKARELYQAGTRNLLIDMSNTSYMGSSGLVALHSIALLFRGAPLPDLESGWDTIHGIDRDRDNGMQQHVKLLNPQPRVERVLEMTGLQQFFETHTNLEEAVASF